MKYLLIGLCLLFVGCDSPIDFMESQTVYEKRVYNGIAIYELKSTRSLKSGEFSTQYRSIKAPEDFASTGDKLVLENGVIKVIKKGEGND